MPEGITPAQRDLLLGAVRDAARRLVMPRFRALLPSDISTKSGPTDLVTLADTEAEADIAAGFEAGCDDFLPKPFSPRELLARLSELVPEAA